MNVGHHEKLLSVSEMAQAVSMSRDRFYDFVRAGIFPPPVYDVVTRRPHYLPEQQRVCLTVRATGMAFNGKQIAFNRTKRTRACRRTASGRDSVDALDAQRIARLARQLTRLGVDANVQAVESAIQHCFPLGSAGVDDAEVVQRLCRSADNPWNANAVEVCSPVSWRKAVGSPFLEATYGV